MPDYSAVSSGWGQVYRLWFMTSSPDDVFTVEFDVDNGYVSDITTQTGNLTQFRNDMGSLLIDGGLYLSNPVTHNDTVTITGDGSTLNVYFGSTLVGTDYVPSAVITTIETTGFEMLAPNIIPPVSGSAATVSIYNSVDPPPTPTPSPTATPAPHGGGGSFPTDTPTVAPTNPNQTPISSNSTPSSSSDWWWLILVIIVACGSIIVAKSRKKK